MKKLKLKDWLNAKDLGGEKSSTGLAFMALRNILFYGAMGIVVVLLLLLIFIVL